jgi:hypothetical protein
MLKVESISAKNGVVGAKTFHSYKYPTHCDILLIPKVTQKELELFKMRF